MSSYRYCLLDSADHVAEFHLIECETDSQAQARADRLLAACGYPSIERFGTAVGECIARERPTRCPFQDDLLPLRHAATVSPTTGRFPFDNGKKSRFPFRKRENASLSAVNESNE